MSTPWCQISTPNRLVVSEYEVPNGFSHKVGHFFWSTLYKIPNINIIKHCGRATLCSLKELWFWLQAV